MNVRNYIPHLIIFGILIFATVYEVKNLDPKSNIFQVPTLQTAVILILITMDAVVIHKIVYSVINKEDEVKSPYIWCSCFREIKENICLVLGSRQLRICRFHFAFVFALVAIIAFTIYSSLTHFFMDFNLIAQASDFLGMIPLIAGITISFILVISERILTTLGWRHSTLEFISGFSFGIMILFASILFSSPLY